MSFELVIRPEAEADARDAFGWYNEQLPGLGHDFLAELDKEFAAIQASPEIHARMHRELRRALLHRFPYGVFYVVEARRIVIMAILHTSRNPGIWSRRRESRSAKDD
jgi:plasmid stabilization system protein ParE